MAAVGAEFKGKAKEPSFYHPAKPAPEPKKESHWPLLIGGALAGAAILLYLRSKSSGGTTGTGSVLTVYPSTTSDQNQIQNMQDTVNTLLQNQNTGATTGNGATPNSQTNVSNADLATVVDTSALNSGGGVSSPATPPANSNPTYAPSNPATGSKGAQTYYDPYSNQWFSSTTLPAPFYSPTNTPGQQQLAEASNPNAMSYQDWYKKYVVGGGK